MGARRNRGKSRPHDGRMASSSGVPAPQSDSPRHEPDVPKERHAVFLEAAKERIERSRTALLIATAALATIWLGGVEQSARRIEDFARSESARFAARREQEENAEATRRQAFEAVDLGRDKKDALIRYTPRESDAPGEIVAWLAKNKEEEHKDKLRGEAAKAVEFDAFSVKIPIPPVLGPLTWLILLAAVLLYMVRDRVRTMSLLGHAVRLERADAKTAAREWIVDAPTWLAPLPSPRPEDSTEAAAFETALAWRHRRVRARWFSASAAAVLFVVVWRVIVVNRDLVDSMGQLERALVDGRRPAWEAALAKYGVPSLATICCLLFVAWRAPFRFSDPFDESRPPEPRVNRRALLTAGAAGAALLAVNLVSFGIPGSRRSRDVSRLLAKLERIRRRRTTPIAGGARRHVLRGRVRAKSSKEASVMHVSNEADAWRFPLKPRGELEEIDAGRLVGLDPSGPSADRVTLAESSWGLEMIALDAVAAGDKTRACDILLTAVRHDMLFVARTARRPSYRLYDLLAGLSARWSLPHLATMTRMIDASTMAPAFRYRIRTWQDVASPWRKRWTAESRVWTVSVAVPKASKSGTKDFKAETEKRRLRLPM
jgi:hypothetical protein